MQLLSLVPINLKLYNASIIFLSLLPNTTVCMACIHKGLLTCSRVEHPAQERNGCLDVLPGTLQVTLEVASDQHDKVVVLVCPGKGEDTNCYAGHQDAEPGRQIRPVNNANT